MNTTKKTVSPIKKSSSAKVIQLHPFREAHSPETQKLINCIWNVSQGALWLNKNFSPKEKEGIKKLISEHFYNGKSKHRNFTELVELICLAKRYAAQEKPTDWLDVRDTLELESMDDCLDKMRSAVPEHSKGIPTFISALLKFIKSPSNTTYYKYRRLLMEQKQYDLLQILNNVIIYFQYSL